MKSLTLLALPLVFVVSISNACVIAQTSSARASSEISPVGDWRGDSICLVRPSACNDEDSLYHVTAIAGKPGQFSLKADKIVDGKPETMGTSDCTFDSKQSILTCNLPHMEFNVTEKTMNGAMFLPDKTRWRKINLKKVS